MSENNGINLPNSGEEIKKRIVDGRVTWTAPLLVVLARPVFFLLAQCLTAFIFWLQRYPSPFQKAAAWWTVYGTLTDICCLALLIILVRREGIRLFDLISFNKKKLKTDILVGIGFFVVIFPLSIFLGSNISSILVYGSLQPVLPEGAYIRLLPLWAVLYSRIIWWIISSTTEELTFQGYASQRLQVLSGRKWIAVLWVCFGWAIQHSLLPFFNVRHGVWVFVMFLPLVFSMQLLYLRFRRLTPFIIAHWAMDFASVIFLVQVC